MRNLVISVRLSEDELARIVRHHEEHKQFVIGLGISSLLRNIALEKVRNDKPFTSDEALLFLAAREINIMQSERNRRAVRANLQAAAVEQEEVTEPLHVEPLKKDPPPDTGDPPDEEAIRREADELALHLSMKLREIE